MPLPTPPVALKDHCSVVYDHTLYTFQPNAFQSLELRERGQWTQLPMGVSTSGSTCIRGSPNGEDSMFIVGGRTNRPTKDFSGLQRYVFKKKKWETIKTSTVVAMDRQGHGAVYLNASSLILIYAGNQDGSMTPSSQTFSISTLPPFNVKAYTSKAPPLKNPLLMPLNSTHALLLGGDPQNKALYTFGPQMRWQPLDVSLRTGLQDSTKVQTAVRTGGDGSQVLEIFDMGASPNRLSTLILQKSTGNNQPAELSGSLTTSPSPSATPQPSRKRKRQAGLANEPAYNDTLAPPIPRNRFSLAQSADGLVAFSGGQPASSDNVVCFFNQTGNQWIDSETFFNGPRLLGDPAPSPTDSSSMPTLTHNPTSSSTAHAASNTDNRPLTILGASLGAVFGVAAILIIILLIIRYIRRPRGGKDKGKTSNHPADDKDEMDFADRGVDFMREAGGSVGRSATHTHKTSGHSAASMGIGAVGSKAGSSQSKRGFFKPGHRPGDSGGSAKTFFSRTKSLPSNSPPLISGPIPLHSSLDQTSNFHPSPEPRTEPRTDIGWSKYFASNNSATNLSTHPARNPRYDSASRPTTYTSRTHSSDYTSSAPYPHESTEIPALSVRTNFSHPANSRIVGPTPGLPYQPGVAMSSGGRGPEPSTPYTLHSDVNEEDNYEENAGHGSEGMASWTPIGGSDQSSNWEDRPRSSVYSNNFVYPHPGERVRIPNFPGVPSSTRNSRADSSIEERGMRSVASKDLRTPPMSDQDRGLADVGSQTVGQSTYGPDPIGRTFPRRTDEPSGRRRGEWESEDMSWLNLGR